MPLSLALDDALVHLDPRLTHGRAILGITGPPGVGKSTATERVLQWAASTGWQAVGVPMDGFHLAQSVLDGRGDAQVKGAPHTFDPEGYAALLRRVRTQQTGDATIWAPFFDRSIENAIAGSIAVTPGDRLIVTEGNYLLLDEAPWRAARAQIDECWYLDLSDEVRRERLTARHAAFGRSPEEASARANGSDEANARLVTAGREAADLVVHVS